MNLLWTFKIQKPWTNIHIMSLLSIIHICQPRLQSCLKIRAHLPLTGLRSEMGFPSKCWDKGHQLMSGKGKAFFGGGEDGPPFQSKHAYVFTNLVDHLINFHMEIVSYYSTRQVIHSLTWKVALWVISWNSTAIHQPWSDVEFLNHVGWSVGLGNLVGVITPKKMSYPNLSWILALPVFVSFRWRSLLQGDATTAQQQHERSFTLKPHVRNHIKNYPDICTQLKKKNPWKTLSCFDFCLWWRVSSTVCAVKATILPALRYHTRYSSPVRARLAYEEDCFLAGGQCQGCMNLSP